MQKKYTKYFDNCLAVFQGGGCKALAYIGAYKEVYERGVIFNELAGTSAGSIIAAFIAAGATPEVLERIILEEDLGIFMDSPKDDRIDLSCWKKIIFYILEKKIPNKRYLEIGKYIGGKFNCKSFCENYGIISTEKLRMFVSSNLQMLTGLNREVLFTDLYPNLHIVATNVITGREIIWSKETPKVAVADAVCASCAIPLFYQAPEKTYVDGGLLSNCPSFIFAPKPPYYKILNFRLTTKNEDIKCFGDFLMRLMSTVIDGAVRIQEQLINNCHDIEIDVTGYSAIDFKLIEQVQKKELIACGQKAAATFLDREDTANIYAQSNVRRNLLNFDQVYTMVALISQKKLKEVYVSTNNTKWVWLLFPTILRWVDNNTKFIVYLPNTIQDCYDKSRRDLLKAIGGQIYEDGISLNGFFLKDEKDQYSGVVYSEKSLGELDTATFYDGEIDSVAIEAWIKKLEKNRTKPQKSRLQHVSIRKLDEHKVIDLLSNQPIYANSSMAYENVEITKLYFISQYVRTEKYQQIDKIFSLYKSNKIPYFVPVELDLLNSDKYILSPIVVEEHGGKLYVIEGKTRLMYAFHHGITSMTVLVIRNVETKLPISDCTKINSIEKMIVYDKKTTTQTDENASFRHIEEWLHPSVPT